MDVLIQVAISNAVMATILAVVAALIGRMSGRPALAHALWLLVLLKLITPPFYAVQVAWFDAPAPSQSPAIETHDRAKELVVPNPASDVWMEAPALEEEQGFPIEDRLDLPTDEAAIAPSLERQADASPRWIVPLAAVWMTGSLFWFTLASARLLRFQRLLRHAWPADDRVQEHVRRLASRLGLPRSPRTWIIPGHVSPLLWAWAGTASLILPHDLLKRLSADQLEALLLHELAHLRRRDHWVRALELVATVLYWWHPVVWWARHELREAEEQCCDAWVVWALPETVRGYALALLETIDFLSEARPALPPATTGIGYVRDLRRRMTMIMRGTTPRALTWSGGLIVLAVAAFMLPLLPTLAQQEPPRRGPSSEEEVKRAEAALRQAAANLDQARAQAEKARSDAEQVRSRKNKADADNEDREPRQRIATNDACMRCHREPNQATGQKLDGKAQDLHEAIVHMSAAVQEHRAHLREMETELKRATAKLVELSQTGQQRFRDEGGLEKLERGQRIIRPDQPRGQEPQPEMLIKRAEEARREERETPEGGANRRLDLEKHTQDRIEALTNQMERVLEELEILRREMRERPNPRPSKDVSIPDKKPSPGRNEREPDSDRPNPLKP
jgi:bla regulator protein blaR1